MLGFGVDSVFLQFLFFVVAMVFDRLVSFSFAGGKLVFQTAKKRANGPKCPITGKRIAGVSASSSILSCVRCLTI